MWVLDDYVNTDELHQLIDEGYVTVKSHEELPLVIYNYSKSAGYDIKPEDWTDTLLKSRGLIVHKPDNLVVAKGMNKFWNFDPEKHMETGPFQVAEKLDGSVGVVFEWDGKVRVATRGSFHSEQADWANNFLDSNPEYGEYLSRFTNSGWTPHVEIIYNSNRIVVDYDFEDLVFLGVTAPEDGQWFPIHEDSLYPGRTAKQYHDMDFEQLLKDRTDAEGYVIQFNRSGNQYKIKHDWYIELHRAVSSLTPKRIWEQLKSGTFDNFVRDLPNEFYTEAEIMANELEVQHFSERNRYKSLFAQHYDASLDRKSQALKVAHLERDEKSAFFLLLDGYEQSFRDYVYDRIKPKGE